MGGSSFLGHENGLGRLLDQVLKGPLVSVGGEVVDGPVGAGVELEDVRRLVPCAGGGGGGAQHLLGVLHEILQARLGDDSTGRM